MLYNSVVETLTASVQLDVRMWIWTSVKLYCITWYHSGYHGAIPSRVLLVFKLKDRFRQEKFVVVHVKVCDAPFVT